MILTPSSVASFSLFQRRKAGPFHITTPSSIVAKTQKNAIIPKSLVAVFVSVCVYVCVWVIERACFWINQEEGRDSTYHPALTTPFQENRKNGRASAKICRYTCMMTATSRGVVLKHSIM